MRFVRPWFVIPIVGFASVAIAAAAGRTPLAALALALLGAALAAAIRAFVGPSAPAAIAAAAGALIGVLGIIELGDPEIRGALAGAAAMFAIYELARPKLPTASPLPAVGAALAAGVLDPSYVTLFAVAGIHLVTTPWPRPRWVIALPIAGGLAIVLAVVAAVVHVRWWSAWLGHAPHAVAIRATIDHAGDLLGPLTAVAAIAGLGICATRGRFAVAAVSGVVLATAGVAFAGAGVAPAIPIVAALGTGVAIGRLAAMIRWPVGQTFLGATAGFVILVVPAYELLVRV